MAAMGEDLWCSIGTVCSTTFSKHYSDMNFFKRLQEWQKTRKELLFAISRAHCSFCAEGQLSFVPSCPPQRWTIGEIGLWSTWKIPASIFRWSKKVRKQSITQSITEQTRNQSVFMQCENNIIVHGSETQNSHRKLNQGSPVGPSCSALPIPKFVNAMHSNSHQPQPAWPIARGDGNWSPVTSGGLFDTEYGFQCLCVTRSSFLHSCSLDSSQHPLAILEWRNYESGGNQKQSRWWMSGLFCPISTWICKLEKMHKISINF